MGLLEGDADLPRQRLQGDALVDPSRANTDGDMLVDQFDRLIFHVVPLGAGRCSAKMCVEVIGLCRSRSCSLIGSGGTDPGSAATGIAEAPHGRKEPLILRDRRVVEVGVRNPHHSGVVALQAERQSEVLPHARGRSRLERQL